MKARGVGRMLDFSWEAPGSVPRIGDLGVGQAGVNQMEEHTANCVKRQAKHAHCDPVLTTGRGATHAKHELPKLAVNVGGSRPNEQIPMRGSRQGSSGVSPLSRT